MIEKVTKLNVSSTYVITKKTHGTRQIISSLQINKMSVPQYYCPYNPGNGGPCVSTTQNACTTDKDCPDFAQCKEVGTYTTWDLCSYGADDRTGDCNGGLGPGPNKNRVRNRTGDAPTSTAKMCVIKPF
jgi:hypothetical protein